MSFSASCLPTARCRNSYTYGSFADRVNCVAHRLVELGLEPGTVVLLAYPPGIEIAVALFACARAGLIAVPVPAPSGSGRNASWNRLAHIATHSGATHILTTSAFARFSSRSPGDPDETAGRLPRIATDELLGRSATFAARPSDVLFLQYTSGSTRAPRGVVVSHANVIHNADLSVDHQHPVGVSWLPHFHDMGLLGYFIFSLVKGGEAHFFAPGDFLRRPAFWLQLISRTRATMTSAPNLAFDYCLRDGKVTDEDLAGVDLSSLRSLMNASEPVRASTFERFWHRFGPYGLRRSAHVAAYGLAEHTLCVTTGGRRLTTRGVEPGVATPSERRHTFVSCGRPGADVDIRIVDPNSCLPVTDEAVGEIWVDSPSRAAGYWRLPDQSKQVFQAHISGESAERTYLRTGDLGFLCDGELYVCGRLRDMLILGGRNVFPNDIEASVEESFTGSLAGRVVAFGCAADSAAEELVILVEAGAECPELSRIRSAVQAACSIAAGTIARVPRGSIVRTSSGKVARELCRQKWERAEFDPQEISRSSQVPGGTLDELIESLAALAAERGGMTATLEQVGLDSIALVGLSLGLEEALERRGLAAPEIVEHVSNLSLLQALSVADLKAGLELLRAGAADAGPLPSFLDGVAQRVAESEQAMMAADARVELPRARKFDGDRSHQNLAFLTGATGFLGAYILKSLLELTDDTVAALVRCDGPQHGMARVRRALADTGMTPASIDQALRGRIQILAGDLSLPQLGLAPADWAALARGTTRIYHCGAAVDYVKSYGLLRPANVDSTREIIRLATIGPDKWLHYISTTFIFGWSVKAFLLESDDNPAMANLDFGYAQSKWVAEQLVLDAQRQQVPARIYRPSLVTASARGHFVRRDITARVLGYMIRHGLAVDLPNQISFLPVDICAQNIVVLSRDGDLTAPVLHMTVDDYYTMRDVCGTVTEGFGYRFREVGLKKFVSYACANCGPDDDLYPLLTFLDRNSDRIVRMGAKRYDNSGFRRARQSSARTAAIPNLAETINPIVVFLRREGLIPPAPRPANDRSMWSRRDAREMDHTP